MTTFYVKVTTDQDEFHIEPGSPYPEVSLTQPAANGRANTELIRELSELLGVNVGIVSGHTSRRKKMVADRSETAIMDILGRTH